MDTSRFVAQTVVMKNPTNKVTVYWTNHGYASQETFDVLADAVAYGKSKCMDCSFWRGDAFLGSWSIFGGTRLEREAA